MLPSLNLHSILDPSLDLYLILNLHLEVVDASPIYLDFIGLTKEDVIGKKIVDLYRQSTNEQISASADNLQTSLQQVCQKKTPHTMILPIPDESSLLNVVNLPLFNNNEMQYVLHRLINNEPIMNKHVLMSCVSQLHESEERFRAAYDFAAIGMALVSLQGRWLHVNKALCQLVGYTESELSKVDFQSITYPDDLEDDLNFVQQLLNGEISSYQMEKRYIHKNGDVIWGLLSVALVRDPTNKPLYFLSQIQDITKQKNTEAQLRYQARHDALTGLLNRMQLEHNLNELLISSKNDKKNFAVFFLDLDNFKQINDALGHIIGDEILIEISKRLLQLLRKDDFIARFGGDEFTIVLPLTTVADIEIVAKKIIKEIGSPYHLNNGDIAYLGASIGIALYPQAGKNLTELLQNADIALMQAKDSGGNSYEFYSETIGMMRQSEFKIQKALYEAVINQQFYLLYQPKFDLKTKKLVGVEALLRWQHPELGLILPDQFISLAEKSGLIVPIGQWVLESACQQYQKWPASIFNQLQLTIAINLSPLQLKNIYFFDAVKQILTNYNVPPKSIELELTEHAIMQHGNSDILLNHLHHLSIQLVIDDFGIGYSSLSRLKNLPINSLKIDKSFVLGVDTEKGNDAIIRSVITLGSELGVNVIAEGIETESQYQFLLSHHCPQGQGHYFSEPLSADAMSELLQQQAVQCKINQ